MSTPETDAPRAATRILVVDDDTAVAEVLRRLLIKEGYAVDVCHDGPMALEAMPLLRPHLVLCDVNMPGLSGIEVCRRLKQDPAYRLTPVVMVTGQAQRDARLQGLEAGADDFLAKPFAVAELRARVRALGRRGSLPRGLTYACDDVVLDFAGRRAQRAGEDVAVTAKEWAILNILAQRAGRIVSRTHVLEGVWADTSESTSNILDVLIARLRRKLGNNLIRTLRGEGYSLAENRLHAK